MYLFSSSVYIWLIKQRCTLCENLISYSWKAVFFTENIYEDVACCADIIYKVSLHEYNRI